MGICLTKSKGASYIQGLRDWREKLKDKSWKGVSYENFCQNINLNLGGYFICSQQISKYFINQGYGNIINIASIYGVVAPRFELYENAKMTMPVEYAVIKTYRNFHFSWFCYRIKLFLSFWYSINFRIQGRLNEKNMLWNYMQTSL